MNATVWVALAGIVGTLLGALLGPWLAERTRRRSAREEQFRTQRLALYADLLRVTGRLTQNAANWSSTPTVDLEDVSSDEMELLGSRADVIASDEVQDRLRDLSRHSHDFHRLLVMEVRPYHQRIHDEGKADDAKAIQQRLFLTDVADKMQAARQELKSCIRSEMRP